MKNYLIIKLSICLIILNISYIHGQEIRLDTTFQVSGDIYPFQGINSITGLNMTGNVELNSDTSLVRVLLQDSTGKEYMIFEAYPLIVTEYEFSVSNACDETCFLDEISPYSLEIQIINAEVTIGTLIYEQEYQENLADLQYAAKRAKDEEKIEIMNGRIPDFNMNWTAGDIQLVGKYYDQKRIILGEGYNMLGYDYYYSGLFEFLGHRNYPKVDPAIVWHFDWRDRHGANDPESPYWDGDTLGTGWLTSVKFQGNCGSCWAFSAVGITEAIANLFTTEHLDYDLSEQQVLSCGDPNGDCDGGYIEPALIFIKNDGIVMDTCCEYITQYVQCQNLELCENPESIVSITDTILHKNDQDSIRISLIEHGPNVTHFYYPQVGPHYAVLAGYEFDPSDSTLTWIFKNSWGTAIGNPSGFDRLKLSGLRAHPIQATILLNDEPLSDTCRDEDEDGFYFWGIGDKPDSCNCPDTLDCDDNDPFVGGYDENYNCSCLLTFDPNYHHITADTTWYDTNYVNYTLLIDSGACLTINSYVGFSPEAGIIVKQGGELIIEGGHLTRACPELWRGIQAWGSDTVQYFSQYFGVVTLTDSAIIEFAKTGIANHCTSCDHYIMQSGGIILADNAIFRNNETDVAFAPFRNMWNGDEQTYCARFQNCRFLTTDEFYDGHLPKTHVELKEVMGITFEGCIFENESSVSTFPYSIRGSGITSTDAHFFLHQYCIPPQLIPCENYAPCEFISLEYGIKALNSTSIRTFNVQEVTFTRNLLGISLSGIDNVSVLSNEFTCLKLDADYIGNRFFGGIFLEGCCGYHIEDNYIHSEIGFTGNKIPAYGIGIKNSGPENNEIYNNDFEGLMTGIISIGENRGRESGLCLKCNDMVGNLNDFIVVEDEDPPGGVYQGIYLYQGNPNDSVSSDAPAGNTFTFFEKPANTSEFENYNYLNDAEDFWYFHHKRQLDPLTYPLDSNYSLETIERKEYDVQYEKFTACPSGLGGDTLKNYTNQRIIICEADIAIAQHKSQLALLVDGGNTEELNLEVMFSLPDDAMELRLQLLNESPYLSDTVIKQSINKEDVLPNAMVRDVLVANPQSAKSSEILSTLDERFEPMPDYMMAQIMEGEEYLGAKELLEAKIQSWEQVRAKAKAELMRKFLLDTNIISPNDSVIGFLQNESDLRSKYDLAFTFWNKLDTSNLIATLDNVPLEYELDDLQITYHQQYTLFFEILKQMQDSGWCDTDLDSLSVQQFFDIMRFGDSKLSASARGLLVKGGFYNYVEKVALPEYIQASQYYQRSKELPAQKNSKEYLKLFPNPAGDYIIAYIDISEFKQMGHITLFDLNGMLVMNHTVAPERNQLVIDLKGLPNGFYIFQLAIEETILESKKLCKGRH